jgi:hypothetical protein
MMTIGIMSVKMVFVPIVVAFYATTNHLLKRRENKINKKRKVNI